jgi:hypothetical protein
MVNMKKLLSKFGRWLYNTFSIYQEYTVPSSEVLGKMKVWVDKPMPRAVKEDATVYVAEVGQINYATPVHYSHSAVLWSTAAMSSNYLTNAPRVTYAI